MANVNFGAKIKKICANEKITYRELSELTGVPYGTLTKYASGHSPPKLSQIEKIANHPRFEKYKNLLFGTSDSELLNEQFVDLFRELEKRGKGEQVLEYLRFLQSQKDAE